MKKIIILFVILLAALLLVTSVSGCQQKTQPAPSSSPSTHPSPAPRPVKYIKMEAAFDKDAYSPEEEITIKLSFTNVTAEPHEISPFPPIVEVRADGKRDNIVRTFAAGSGNVTVPTGETAEHTLVWDQQDEQGQQVAYGYYDFYIPDGGTLEDKAIVGGIHILPAEGVIEQTINVDKSLTVGPRIVLPGSWRSRTTRTGHLSEEELDRLLVLVDKCPFDAEGKCDARTEIIGGDQNHNSGLSAAIS